MAKLQLGIVLLAAGASERMGTPKQLLTLAGQSLISRMAVAALEADCGPVVTVLGAHAERIRPELDQMDLYLAFNSRWQVGMSTSIHCGLTTLLVLAPDTEAVVLMVADQPEITAGSLQRLARAYRGEEAGLAAARFAGILGTPALFARRYFPELLRLEGKGGARGLLDRHREKVVPVDLPEAGRDLDTAADLTAFLQGEEPGTETGPGGRP